MTKLPAPNFHENEEPTIPNVSGVTTATLNTLQQSLGTLSQSTFAALNAALETVLSALQRVKQETTDKKKVLSANRERVDFAVIRIPNPPAPDTEAASQTINTVLGGQKSPDIQELHRSVFLAQLIRIPEAVTNFEKRKIALVGGKLDAQISAVSSAQDNVSAVQKSVESRT
jgi:hypothetical protein